MTDKYDDRGLLLAPHQIRIHRGCKEAWWYEDARGVDVHLELEGAHASVRIPWGQLKKALARLGKPDA